MILKMINHKRIFFACTSSLGFSDRLAVVAAECAAELRFFDHQSLSVDVLLSEVDGILLAFECFDIAASVLIDQCRQKLPGIPIIVLLPAPSATDVVQFTRYGVLDCLDEASEESRIFDALRSAIAEADRQRKERAASAAEPWRRHLVGESRSLEDVVQIIQLVAARKSTVLITGETGSGKEMAARAIHMASDRCRKAFVCINCGAIPENLIEAELFGHVKGAFTGAIQSRMGRFELANGGTLFLDEVADLPFDLQAKLLRVLQEREIHRLGSNETIKTDVRVIAATNADLLTRVQQGRFREDLYYRLNVVPIHMPALRERESDIALLVKHFVQKVCSAENLDKKSIAPEALLCLASYSWPGNVRQLENVVEHAVVMSGNRACLFPSDFALAKVDEGRDQGSSNKKQNRTIVQLNGHQAVPEDGIDFAEALRQFERALLREALSKARGNKTLAADMLRLPRTTLLHKLRTLELTAAA